MLSLALFCLLAVRVPLYAQPAPPPLDKAALPFFTCISPKMYDGAPRTWSIVQDQQGVMYFGNNAGVLEYDGARWRRIETANKDVVRSLAIDDNGRIYVGASADFGYLAPDAAGQLHYQSLLDHVAEKDRAFNLVWTVHATPEGIYFQARERLFRFTPDGNGGWDVAVWEPQGSFYYAFWLQGTYYVHQGDVGLMKMTDGQLQLVAGGAQFANERLQVLLPFEESGRLLVGTFNRGLFLFDGQAFQPFETEADGFLLAHTLYRGAVLPGGLFVLTTMSGGVVILDRAGRMLHHLDRARGLPGDRVLAAFVDRTGLLWLTPENGICPTEAQVPLSHYDAASGLTSFVVKVIRHRGVLYALTLQGLLYLDEAAALFKPVAGFSGGLNEILDGMQIDGQLLVTSSTGIYQVDEGRARPLTRTIPGGASPLLLAQSRQDARRVFIGISNGLASMRRAGPGQWVEEGYIPGIHEYLTHIVEPEPGVVWLGTLSRGALRVRFAEASRRPSSIERFGVEHGLPAGGVSIYEAAGRLLFATREGIFRFSEAGQFEPDPLFKDVVRLQGSQQTYAIVEDDRGHLWINFGRESAVLRRQSDGSYQADKTALLRFADIPVSIIYPEPGGIVWFGGNESLIRYNPSIPRDYAIDYPALIRRVTVGTDSLVYGGAFLAAVPPPVLRFAENALHFEYAATTFEQPTATRYRSMLDGFEAGWSTWRQEAQRDYTNLPPGGYTFRVQAKNIYGHESAEAAYAFTVLAPWYRTGWAYTLYALLIGLGIFSVDRVQRRRLLHKERKRAAEELRRKDQYNRQLQQEVAARTAEVERQKQQLEEQAQALRSLDEAKSRFFANISHEFRTPLTLTIGPLDDLLSGRRGPLSAAMQRDIDLALRNSRRQLRLVNQILDVAKLEAGAMKLQAREADLNAFLNNLTLAFAPLAERKRIRYHVALPAEPTRLYFDPDQLEKVFTNLLSNAFKFTPEGGAISCSVCTREADGHGQAGWVEVAVRDTGPGLSAEEQAHVFERFYEADESAQGRQAGTGIGLALVKELVGLHSGTIRVESPPGFGTTFTVALRQGRDHFQETDIVEGVAPDWAEAGAVEAPFDGPALPAPAASVAETADVTTVLVVDDNADIRRYVRSHLEPRYRVVEAADGAEGLDRARALLPDLVLSDVMMPRMDGHQLCQALKQDADFDFIPVILLTAKAETAEKIGGLQGGADDYITKPFNADELVARVDNLIASRRRLWARLEQAQSAPKATLPAEAIDVVSTDAAFLEQVRATVEAHLEDSSFDVEELAAALGLGRTTLYRRLGALLEISPNALIVQIRLERAAQLLKGGAGLVSEVAYAVGFKSVAHFSKRFRDHHGVPPSRYATAEGAG